MSVEQKLKKLCKVMHQVQAELVVHDGGNGLRLDWSKAKLVDQDAVQQVQDLAYREKETIYLLGLLEDGRYPAAALWLALMPAKR